MGMFGGKNVWQIYFFRVFGKQIDQPKGLNGQYKFKWFGLAISNDSPNLSNFPPTWNKIIL